MRASIYMLWFTAATTATYRFASGHQAVSVSEWPGGVTPPGSLRTALEPLDSYGSHHPPDRRIPFPQWSNSWGFSAATALIHMPARVLYLASLLYFRIAQCSSSLFMWYRIA